MASSGWGKKCTPHGLRQRAGLGKLPATSPRTSHPQTACFLRNGFICQEMTGSSCGLSWQHRLASSFNTVTLSFFPPSHPTPPPPVSSFFIIVKTSPCGKSSRSNRKGSHLCWGRDQEQWTETGQKTDYQHSFNRLPASGSILNGGQ